jgi:hypothetical protein
VPIVSLGLPDPVVKTVLDTAATKDGSKNKVPLSVTVMVPSCPESELALVGAEPKVTDVGALMARPWASDGVVRTATAAVPATIAMRRPILMRTLRFRFV